VRVCFDADEAGQNAAWRTAQAARGVPVALSAVELPAGADPGELGATDEGRQRLVAAVEGAAPLVISLIRARAARTGGSARERDQALDEITELLRGLPDSIERDEAVRVATSELGLSRGMEERLRGEIGGPAQPSPDRAATDRGVSPRVALERRVLSLGIGSHDDARTPLEALSPDVFDDSAHGRAFALMSSGVAVEEWPAEMGGLATALRAEAPDEVSAPELQEAVYRLQIDELDRRASRARADADEAGLLEAVTLRDEIRKRLRGDA
jgi:DNA primase